MNYATSMLLVRKLLGTWKDNFKTNIEAQKLLEQNQMNTGTEGLWCLSKLKILSRHLDSGGIFGDLFSVLESIPRNILCRLMRELKRAEKVGGRKAR